MQRTYQFSKIGPTHADGAIFAALTAAGRRQHFSTGAHVIHRGDPGTGFWLIEEGEVMACRFGRDGERILYGVLGRGDLIGELACFAEVPQQVHAIAEGEVVLTWIDMAQFDDLIAKEPRLARWLLGTLANKMRTALDHLERTHSLSAQVRIARLLADVSAEEGPDLNITQQQLADHVGVSRVTVGQVLAKFASEQLIETRYGGIRVKDRGALAALED